MLLGRDHPALGERALERVGERTAIGLSAGRLPKAYAHVDPNEDAALAIEAAGWTLLAVADGHNGADASHAAMAAVHAATTTPDAAGLSAPALLELARLTAADAVRSAVAAAAGDADGRELSRTALTVAVVADGRVHAATWGDTTAARVRRGWLRRRPAVRLLSAGTAFLGPHPQHPATASRRLRAGDRVALCSDGVVDHLGPRWTAVLGAALTGADEPVRLVDTMFDRAFDGGAGDHLSMALTVVR
jgi:serine/threonine protein phosphatase PrpC